MAHRAFMKAFEELVKKHFQTVDNLDENICIEHDGQQYRVHLRMFAQPVYVHLEGEHFKSLTEMLKYMKEAGGTWVASDDPVMRLIGYARDTEPGEQLYIPLTSIKEEMPGLTKEMKQLIQTATGRRKIAEMCSS